MARVGPRPGRARARDYRDRGTGPGRARLSRPGLGRPGVGRQGVGCARGARHQSRLSWAELCALLKGAAVYVGPDTSTTHLAAAAGCPTIALYGPTSPRLIGPWPVGGLDPPWDHAGTIQRRGNVWVVQNPLPCLPCEKLGCEGHLASYSRCLDELSVGQVLAAVDDALSRPGAPNRAMSHDQRPAFLRWTKLETSKLS